MASWKDRLKNLGSGMGVASAGDLISNLDAAKDWVERSLGFNPAERGSSGRAKQEAEQKKKTQQRGGGGGGGDGGGGAAVSSFSAPAVDPDAAQIADLRSRITGRGSEIADAYEILFGDLDKLLRSRSTELEEQYGDQLETASNTYAEAIPEIDASYAALGAYDSTNRGDARTKADKGFQETTKTIGKNKEKDLAALGQYGKEQRARFKADRDAANRAVSSAGETTDVDALRGLANDLDTNLSQTGVTRATLGTDGSARKELGKLTDDAGRYQAAVNALDSIINSSMSGAVKQAAVTAVTDAGGLSDVEKKKIQDTYGNVYSEQAAL